VPVAGEPFAEVLVCCELWVCPVWDLVLETALPIDEGVLGAPALVGGVGWTGWVITGLVTVNPRGARALAPWTADRAAWLVC
jgi:hypothetical protein